MERQKHFFTAATKWAELTDNDIVLSTRVRLARNIDGYAFPRRLSAQEGKQMVEKVMQAMAATPLGQGKYDFFRGEDISEAEKAQLLEKHLISPEFMREGQGQGLLISEDESIVVMVNEEDHIRIQSFLPGSNLSGALAGANLVDDWLEQGLDWAFDDNIGYLTTCPSNVGTGMRASVMMHLPALHLTGKLEQIFAAIPKLGLTVRGMYGEGSESLGNLYQISNQVTLGYSENEIIARLETVIAQIAAEENKARNWLKEQQGVKLADSIWRAYGTACFARSLTLKEMMEILSWLRLGIHLEILDKVTKEQLNTILIGGQDHFLTYGKEEKATGLNLDILRAEKMRETLAK